MAMLLESFTLLLSTEEKLTVFASDHITRDWLGGLLKVTLDNSMVSLLLRSQMMIRIFLTSFQFQFSV